MVKIRKVFKYTALVVLVIALGLLVRFVLHLVLPRNYQTTGKEITLHLKGGDLVCPYFAPGSIKLEGEDASSDKHKVPSGIIVLGSGDGGWSYWEDNTARALAARGHAVIGWSCRAFSDTRKYDHTDLVNGFNTAVEAAQSASGNANGPVWYGGWSTGAEQSVAAAASENRPKQLVGLLLAAPGTRGRYGIETSDLLGIVPTGENTFAMADVGKELKGIRVAQFTAGLDPMDDVDWLQSLSVPYHLFELPGLLHDMGGAGKTFQETLREAMAWTLEKQ